MSVYALLAIGLFGGVGGVLRFLLDGFVQTRVSGSFPFGTFVVNLSGAFVLGMLVGLVLSDDSYRLLGTGLIGGYTTFSTWALESHRLGEDGALRIGATNFAASLVLGVLAACAGRALGGAL
jgi:CrcB protein